MKLSNANQTVNPSIAPSQNSASEHIAKNHKRFLRIAIGVLIVAAIGAYFLSTQKSQIHETTQTRYSQTPPSPTNVQHQEPSKTVSQGSFQDILTENCENDGIDANRVPVTIDQNIVDISYRAPNKFVCSGFEGTQDFIIQLQDRSMIIVYDENTQELGHGGPPYLGSFGTPIKDDGNITITVYIIGYEGPTPISSARVIMRGMKRLKLSTGDTAYANYSTTAIEPNDRRLVEFLDPYARPSSSLPGIKELIDFPTVELKDRFFSNLSNLGLTENDALSKIERVLSAISPK